MADTYTQFLNLTRPEVGASRDTWGDKWNENATALDNWAKATDKLAKDALSRVATAAQTVAGPVTYSGALTASAGVTIPEAQQIGLGKGYIRGEAGRTLLAAAADNFEVVNQANSAYILQASIAGGFQFRGQTVYHTGNLAPANYFDKATATGQNVNNIPSFNASAIDIVRANVLRARFSVDGGGTTILSNGDTADNIFYVTRGGSVWTKEFGDLNTRIENRAAAFANNALATARAEYANHAKLSGAGFTGDVSGPHFTATGGDGYVALDSRDGARGALFYNVGNLLRIFDRTGGDRVRFSLVDGGIWTNQFGDVSQRIEDRAYAWANDRLAVARAEYANHAKRTEFNDFSQDQQITKAYPTLALHYPNVEIWRLNVREWGGLEFSSNDGAGAKFQIYRNGQIWTAQIGDLNNRIEARAQAFADDRKASLENWTLANFNNKTSPNRQDHSGDILIRKNEPRLKLDYSGVGGWAVYAHSDSRLYFQKEAGYAFQSNPVHFGPGGDIATAQIGDLNTRIENRAAAFADDRMNSAKTEANRITGRLAYAGDLDNGWNINQSYAEPYGGAVLTSRYTTNNQFTVSSWQGGRWRYMQMKGTNDSWYTISYV